eukprot:CAMPEP_0118859142 /NCGR_PEP_ID=MMETSP1163-20130328/5518_1 /TAXON_ID=124430 /ORGANISM="Phaeomonas parva, Strain CCMP2877" /LENGTH=175 /DNA_ID=CAMNT_0006792689 /DNA_START=468 /DNA_END=992 /DNA_ORIENTATION=-
MILPTILSTVAKRATVPALAVVLFPLRAVLVLTAKTLAVAAVAVDRVDVLARSFTMIVRKGGIELLVDVVEAFIGLSPLLHDVQSFVSRTFLWTSGSVLFFFKRYWNALVRWTLVFVVLDQVLMRKGNLPFGLDVAIDAKGPGNKALERSPRDMWMALRNPLEVFRVASRNVEAS